MNLAKFDSGLVFFVALASDYRPIFAGWQPAIGRQAEALHSLRQAGFEPAARQAPAGRRYYQPVVRAPKR